MFHLPREIQDKIYEYDPTYRQLFDWVLEELIDEDMDTIIDCLREGGEDNFCGFQKDEDGDIIYYITFDDGSVKECMVVDVPSLRHKIEEHLNDSIQYCEATFLAPYTNLTTKAINALKTGLEEEEYMMNLKNVIGEKWDDMIKDMIEKDGEEHYLDVFWDVVRFEYDYERDVYILFL